jgi:hypothetical protein
MLDCGHREAMELGDRTVRERRALDFIAELQRTESVVVRPSRR